MGIVVIVIEEGVFLVVEVKEYVAKNRLTIHEEMCKGCGLCVWVCPKKVLATDPKRVNAKGYNPATCTDINTCIACGMCARMCPDSVIKVERDI